MAQLIYACRPLIDTADSAKAVQIMVAHGYLQPKITTPKMTGNTQGNDVAGIAAFDIAGFRQ